MTPVITQSEVDRLRAPFPLAAHSIREGNKVRGGQGIQWFVYVEKTEVENRLNEVFPGEWGSSQPVLTIMGNSVAATISINIRGISRGNTGEDSNGTEKAKGATTDAFRRAAADWGIAKYLWEMDFQIYTDTYPDKDWKARDAREKDALDKFAAWYKKKFQNVTPLASQNGTQTHQEAHTSDLPIAAGEYTPATPKGARTPQQALNGNGAHPGEKKRIGNEPPKEGDYGEFQVTSVKVVFKDGQPRYALNATDNAVIWAYSRDVFRGMGYPEGVIEDWGAKEQTIKFEQKMPLQAEWKLYKTGKEPRGGYWSALFEAPVTVISEEPF